LLPISSWVKNDCQKANLPVMFHPFWKIHPVWFAVQDNRHIPEVASLQSKPRILWQRSIWRSLSCWGTNIKESQPSLKHGTAWCTQL
jgi:hypothetical protein